MHKLCKKQINLWMKISVSTKINSMEPFYESISICVILKKKSDPSNKGVWDLFNMSYLHRWQHIWFLCWRFSTRLFLALDFLLSLTRRKFYYFHLLHSLVESYQIQLKNFPLTYYMQRFLYKKYIIFWAMFAGEMEFSITRWQREKATDKLV